VVVFWLVVGGGRVYVDDGGGVYVHHFPMVTPLVNYPSFSLIIVDAPTN